MQNEKRYEVKVQLTQNEASSILKFLDRAHFDTYLSLSENRSEKEAYTMRDALTRVASAIIADITPSGGGTGGGGIGHGG